jgi:hypothetical protein
MTISSWGYGGTIAPDVVWANMQKTLGAKYMVASPTDCTPTPVSGGTRQVQIGTGYFGGHGILDQVTVAEVVALPSVATGTKFFMIKAIRNWSTKATTITYQDLGTTYTAPVTRTNITPGTLDDHPLAVFSLAAGSTNPVLVKNLRAMGGPNFYVMESGLVPNDFAWLEQTGVTVQTGRVAWRRRLDPDTGSLTWDRDPAVWEGSGFLTDAALTTTEKSHWGWSGATLAGASSHALRTFTGHVTLSLALVRQGGDLVLGTTGNVTDERMIQVSVSKLRPTFTVDALIQYITESNTSRHGFGRIDSDGFVWITDMAPSTTLPSGNAVRVTVSYDTEA